MKKTLFLLIASLICFTDCTAQKITRMTSLEAYDFINKDPNTVIVDVRTPKEFADGHIKGAVNIDVTGDNFETVIDSLDKSKTYLVYCRSGRRSMNAAKVMQSKKFEHLYEISDGFKGWQSNKLPSEQ